MHGSPGTAGSRTGCKAAVGDLLIASPPIAGLSLRRTQPSFAEATEGIQLRFGRQGLSCVARQSEAAGGQGWIRTSVGKTRQIYSLLPLTTRPPVPGSRHIGSAPDWRKAPRRCQRDRRRLRKAKAEPSGRGGGRRSASLRRPRRAAPGGCRTPRSRAARRSRHCPCCSISHWSQVIGAPGSQPNSRAISRPIGSGMSTTALEPRPVAWQIHSSSSRIVSVLRPAELVGLAAMAARVERRLRDRLAEVGGIDRLQLPAAADHRHDRQQPRHAGEAVDEIVLRPEHDRGPHDGRAGKGLAHRQLAFALACGRSGLALGIGADRRDVDQRPRRRPRPPPRRRCAAPSTWTAWKLPLRMPTRLITASAPATAARDLRRRRVMSARTNWIWPSAAQRLQEEGAARLALGDADPRAGLEQRLRDIAAEEAAAAEQGDQPVRLHRHARSPSECGASYARAPLACAALRALTIAGPPPNSRRLPRAQMAELVDAPASGAGARKGVEVRVLFWAP